MRNWSQILVCLILCLLTVEANLIPTYFKDAQEREQIASDWETEKDSEEDNEERKSGKKKKGTEPFLAVLHQFQSSLVNQISEFAGHGEPEYAASVPLYEQFCQLRFYG